MTHTRNTSLSSKNIGPEPTSSKSFVCETIYLSPCSTYSTIPLMWKTSTIGPLISIVHYSIVIYGVAPIGSHGMLAHSLISTSLTPIKHLSVAIECRVAISSSYNSPTILMFFMVHSYNLSSLSSLHVLPSSSVKSLLPYNYSFLISYICVGAYYMISPWTTYQTCLELPNKMTLFFLL